MSVCKAKKDDDGKTESRRCDAMRLPCLMTHTTSSLKAVLRWARERCEKESREIIREVDICTRTIQNYSFLFTRSFFYCNFWSYFSHKTEPTTNDVLWILSARRKRTTEFICYRQLFVAVVVAGICVIKMHQSSSFTCWTRTRGFHLNFNLCCCSHVQYCMNLCSHVLCTFHWWHSGKLW